MIASRAATHHRKATSAEMRACGPIHRALAFALATVLANARLPEDTGLKKQHLAVPCLPALLRAVEGRQYKSWVRSPEELRQSNARFVLNPMKADHGHVGMAMNFTALLGFQSILTEGVAAAKQLQQEKAPFVYLTLTNDHQHLTESGHDRTLKWERSEESQSAAGIFIGPPAAHVLEGPRKKIFCQLSEGLVRRTGDPWQRFTPPCVARNDSSLSSSGEEYAELIRSAPSLVKTPGYEQLHTTPRWLMRKVETKKVAAAGEMMNPLTHEKAMRTNVSALRRYALLLLRYLDPPLLQHAVHLGTPVRTRVEVRMFGLVQWEPLRIWTSRYGFFRGGTPWLNYSMDADFKQANINMWNVNKGVEAKCQTSPPANPPPWRDADSYRKCKQKQWKTQCCICLTVADVFDIENDEAGFATGGTLKRLEQVATAAGLDPRRVWQSAEEAIIRSLMAEQRSYQREAQGAPLSRWATLFSTDVGFAADGRAYLYENLLMPNWKRPGYFWHEAVDRAQNIGIYSGQMLAMAPLLMKPDVNTFHSQLLAPLGLGKVEAREVIEFLRTQGLASELGFRRTWPSLPRAHAHSFDAIADSRDIAFAKLLNKHRLLLPQLDVLSHESTPEDLWGGTSADPSRRWKPHWPVGNGVLWDVPTGMNRGVTCDDTPRILAGYAKQAAEGKANNRAST